VARPVTVNRRHARGRSTSGSSDRTVFHTVFISHRHHRNAGEYVTQLGAAEARVFPAKSCDAVANVLRVGEHLKQRRG
jgi:hypothetical protein